MSDSKTASDKVDPVVLDEKAQELLNKLKIVFGPQTLKSDEGEKPEVVDPTMAMLAHIVECIAAMHKIVRVYRGNKKDTSKSVAYKMTNALTGELGKLLVFAMTNQWNADEKDIACKFINVGKEILKSFPEMASRKHKGTGKMLIHHVALTASPVTAEETISCILSVHPTSASSADDLGALPLHHAMRNPLASFEIADSLLQAFPDGANVQDKMGLTPLHWAVNTDRQDLELVRGLLEVNPKAAGIACAKGSLPLHWCVNRDEINIPVMDALLHAAPDAVRTQCSDGWLPIHRCVNRPEPSIQALKMLISAYPEGLLVANRDGQLPLHKSVDHEYPSLEAVRTILDTCPAAAEVSDNEGYLPLHVLIDCPIPDLLVAEKLLKVYPASAKMATRDGLLPLHIVLSSNDIPSVEFVSALVAVYPDSVKVEATDYLPADERAYAGNRSGWQGLWREKKWTALSRAEERGFTEISSLLRSAASGAMVTPALGQVRPQLAPSSGLLNGSRSLILPKVTTGDNSLAPLPVEPVPLGLKIAAEKTTFIAGGSGPDSSSISSMTSARHGHGIETDRTDQHTDRSDMSPGYRKPRRQGSSRMLDPKSPAALTAMDGAANTTTSGSSTSAASAANSQVNNRWAAASGLNAARSQDRPGTNDSSHSGRFALPAQRSRVDEFVNEGHDFIEEFTAIELGDGSSGTKKKKSQQQQPSGAVRRTSIDGIDIANSLQEKEAAARVQQKGKGTIVAPTQQSVRGVDISDIV